MVVLARMTFYSHTDHKVTDEDLPSSTVQLL